MKESMQMKTKRKTPLKILDLDPWLAPYEDDLRARRKKFREDKKRLLDGEASLSQFANAHLYFGFHFSKEGCVYREWAPAAEALFLMGDFNGWNENSHPLTQKEEGVWEIVLPPDCSPAHLSLVKTLVWKEGRRHERIPLYIRRVHQDPSNFTFAGQIWEPGKKFRWTDKKFALSKRTPLLIYEAHIGMAQEKEGIGSFREFADHILPRIQHSGYNCIQLMAIMSHPYYASFGYHVANFFAVSSWFGTPDELKYLINKAHSMGIAVLMDIVHSHAAKNTAEGINEFDGTAYQFFHSGERGDHSAWDSKVFDYGKSEVLHFLLSNIKYWMLEYHFDGFRFDGVTSMLYLHHGLGMDFDHYDKYFSDQTDKDAVTYLQLANTLIHELNSSAVSIAEDMSGMPGICLPVQSGGLGFDYRLAMGIADFWIRLLDQRDEYWNMRSIWHELTGKRPCEKRIAYAESHDQALVGDKTLIFRLADKEMYWHMNKDDPNLIIDRALALHKMIRFITLTLGGEGYLNFMGNEFGHPEWIDFPREGNDWSFRHCRRQWSLVDNGFLKYEYLNEFDKDMKSFSLRHKLLREQEANELWLDNSRKIIIYRKAELIFVFNFHPTRSYENFYFPTHEEASYLVIFDSDASSYGGYDRISRETVYKSHPLSEMEGMNGITIYTPSRTVLVLKKI